MLKCWDELPQNRPTFTQIRSKSEHIYWNLINKSPEYLKSEYERVKLIKKKFLLLLI